jgi:hypothetical protein
VWTISRSGAGAIQECEDPTHCHWVERTVQMDRVTTAPVEESPGDYDAQYSMVRHLKSRTSSKASLIPCCALSCGGCPLGHQDELCEDADGVDGLWVTRHADHVVGRNVHALRWL